MKTKLFFIIAVLAVFSSCTSVSTVPAFYYNRSGKTYHRAVYNGRQHKTIRKARLQDSLPWGNRSYMVDTKKKK